MAKIGPAIRGEKAAAIRANNDKLMHMSQWLNRNRGKIFRGRPLKTVNYIVITECPPSPRERFSFKTKAQVIAFQKTHPLSAYIYRKRDQEIYML